MAIFFSVVLGLLSFFTVIVALVLLLIGQVKRFWIAISVAAACWVLIILLFITQAMLFATFQ